MRVLARLILMVLAVALPTQLSAQPPLGDNIALMFHLKPKAGMANQFAAALKSHAEWRKANNDPLTWITMQVVSGPGYGDYYIRAATTWAGLDAYSFREKGGQNFLNSVDPFLESIDSWITADVPSVSNWPPGMPPRLLRVETYRVNPAKGRQFWAAIAKAGKAIGDKIGPYGWSVIVDGAGFGTEVSAVMPGQKWSDFKPREAEMIGYLNEALGPEGTAQVFADFLDAAQPVRSLIVEVRVEMSVLPN